MLYSSLLGYYHWQNFLFCYFLSMLFNDINGTLNFLFYAYEKEDSYWFILSFVGKIKWWFIFKLKKCSTNKTITQTRKRTFNTANIYLRKKFWCPTQGQTSITLPAKDSLFSKWCRIEDVSFFLFSQLQWPGTQKTKI